MAGFGHDGGIPGDVLVHRRSHPPLDPNDTAEETTRVYTDNQLRMQIGFAMMIFFAYLYAPFFAVLSRQIRRIEGYWARCRSPRSCSV